MADNLGHRIFLATAAVVVFLSSCTTVDPQFAALESKIQTNPPANAIVGMWYRKQGGLVMTRLYKSDGTGLCRTKSSVLGDAIFTWKYDGGGWWTLNAPGGIFRSRITASGEMLDYWGDSRVIYTRAE